MRPPMQAAALQQQQHEIIHQQQQQLQQQQQQQESLTTTANLTNHHQQQQQRKSKLHPKEILAENHLNLGAAANFEQTSATFASIVPSRTYQQQQQQQRRQQQQHHYENIVDDSIQLVDLCNSSAYSKITSQQRPSSLISECTYSRSSSSEDGSYASERFLQYHPDPAEHFIINFPAADSPTHNQNDVVIHLPLSETEPLLTNIETTHSGDDTQRSICLSKNSASLIFTRKDLSQDRRQQQQQQRNNISNLTTANGNNNFSVATTHKRQSVSNIDARALKATTATANRQTRRQHHSFKSAERSRKQQQHLAQQQQQQQQSKYFVAQQQQHRRSLQLNYNNNLISSSNFGCGSNNSGSHNNNFCCSSSPASALSSSSNYTTPVATGITAAVTRKQHAYSWYAPVYSALEEELEQDSRDSSPIHNLANTKKHHPHHHYQQHRSLQNSTTSADNETVALLETRNQINTQAQLHLQSTTSNSNKIVAANTAGNVHHTSRGRSKSAAQAPTSLPLQLTGNPNSFGDLTNGAAATSSSYDGEGPQAGSLGLAGGPLPRWKNFFMSLVGIRPSSNGGGSGGGGAGRNSVSGAGDTANSISASGVAHISPPPASPEITITRTPSEQNIVVMRDPSGRERKNSGNEKLANGSTSSLNVVQQKLWNIMRRDGSAASLFNEKSHSIVQYTGLRKCETVLALTRQSSSICSPVLGVGPGIIGGAATKHHSGGSGIFSANGVEQIRPLNRLRNSMSTMNATCSRCSSLLSLAASGSRYSLNIAASGGACGFVNTATPTTSTSSHHQHHYQQQQQQNSSNKSSGRNRSNSGTSGGGASNSRKSSAGAQSLHSASNSLSPPSSNLTTATFTPLTSSPTTPTNKSQDFNAAASGSLLGGFPPPMATATSSITKQPPITVTSLLSMTSSSSSSSAVASSASSSEEEAAVNVAGKSSIRTTALSTSKRLSPSPSSSSTSSSSRCTSKHQRRSQQKSKQQNQEPQTSAAAAAVAVAPATIAKPFEMFTCKLCLVDVEIADEATTLLLCGCQFCTECMKAYIEFEISEGAYEISCPDAQCPAQGIITIPEIANLTTANLMKKHHRYRLNREIELDKSRTWCPRAGCETVCLVGQTANIDAAPSTSTSHSGVALSLTSPATIKDAAAGSGSGGDPITQLLCAVQCPSCKDEFCSACKKAWHPNTTCEENSRRLVADGQDDIGIPFDNDLIKCCPMCAVPIEKDEGCAQMMCKRCKHVFCWYCLASLDDDFLLRHYDRGPCKNKLGHSRASVVWHRAQVIGIFAGFGILLLVASPLLLLAAPCIICCKCRICSGSKVDEGDGELDEATALQS